jgi:cell division septal protein FtsQ
MRRWRLQRRNSRRRDPRPGALRPFVWAGAAALGLALGGLGGVGRIPALAPLLPRLAGLSETGARQVDVTALAAAAGLGPGALLGPGSLGRLRDGLLEDPWIREARVVALPTGRLLVGVAERLPVARTALGQPVQLYWVDAEGLPFAPAPAEAGLPVLEGVADARPGQADPVLRQGVEILDLLRRHGLPAPQSVVLGGDAPDALPALWLPLPGGRTCHVILGAAHLDARVDRLAQLLAAKLPEALAAGEIDLRFGAQVVLRSAVSPGSTAPRTAAEGGGAATSRGGGAAPETGRAG